MLLGSVSNSVRVTLEKNRAMLVGARDGGLCSLHLGLHKGPVEPFPTLLIGQVYIENIKINPGGDCGPPHTA